MAEYSRFFNRQSDEEKINWLLLTMRLMSSSTTFCVATGRGGEGRGGARCSLLGPARQPAQIKPLPRCLFLLVFLLNPSTPLFPLSASSASLQASSLHLSTLHLPLFTSLFLSHCHLVLTPSPQSLHSSSSSSGDEVQLFDRVLPLAGKSHPSGVVASGRLPAAVHAHGGHAVGAPFAVAVVVVAWRRVGVHLDHVVAVHDRRDADVLLRLGLLVVAEPAHGGHHPAASSSVASDYQTHRQQLVLQTVR